MTKRAWAAQKYGSFYSGRLVATKRGEKGEEAKKDEDRGHLENSDVKKNTNLLSACDLSVSVVERGTGDPLGHLNVFASLPNVVSHDYRWKPYQ